MPTRRLKQPEEVIEGEEVKKTWDFKKIAGGLLLLALLFILGSYIFLPRYSSETANTKKDTLGISSDSDENVPPLPKQEDIENILNNAQNTLSDITSENLTSSQAGIQKVITDLQSLQNNPGDIFCDLVCKK